MLRLTIALFFMGALLCATQTSAAALEKEHVLVK